MPVDQDGERTSCFYRSIHQNQKQINPFIFTLQVGAQTEQKNPICSKTNRISTETSVGLALFCTNFKIIFLVSK